jgi:multiple sugar transport system permease protein
MKKNKKSKTVFNYIVIVLGLIIFLFPVYWMIVSSFHSNAELMSFPPKFTFKNGTFANYVRVFGAWKFVNYFKNSVIVATSSVFFSILISLFAGFAFSRYRFAGKSLLMTAILNIQVFPVTVIIIALFSFYSKMNLLDTYQGLIFADIVYSLPFTVWFLKAFFDTIPKSLDEAAKIDGCGRLRTLFSVLMPLLKPGMISVGIYTFLYSWDDFVFALTILKTEKMKTLPLGLVQSFMGEFSNDYAGMMTLSVLTSLPVVFVFLLTQKYMISGLTAGAVKG